MGLSYDMYTENETVAIISDFIDSSNGGIICRSDLNVSTIVTAQTDSFIKGFINSSDIVNIDGMGVILGGKFLNKPLPQRIAGADLFERLLNVSDKKGYSVYFLGATQEVVESTACKAKKEYPNLVISGFHDGYFGTEQEKVVDEINRCAPDMLFIGTKSPDKELFIAKYKA
ncbi:MAG: WecB/TagA/CpsF family glycosyltransferase, partial [Colwellia sp.]